MVYAYGWEGFDAGLWSECGVGALAIGDLRQVRMTLHFCFCRNKLSAVPSCGQGHSDPYLFE